MKNEIAAKLDGYKLVQSDLKRVMSGELTVKALSESLSFEISKLEVDMSEAEEDLASSIIRSHKAVCEAKQMEENAAYGHDPAVYYSLAICGEAGEMANAIVKSMRNGTDTGAVLEAVKSELPDVVIYSYVLAHVLKMDLPKLVNEKVEIVIKRAYDGYYGPKLKPNVPGSKKQI